VDDTLDSPQPARSRSHSRNKSAEQYPRPAPEYLWVGSAGAAVAPWLCLDKPLIAQLVSEDACWRMTVEHWHSRKPSWWHVHARSEWKAEGELLDAKKIRLKEQAATLGIRPSVRSKKRSKRMS
jgi:hypothetical protein